jgi:hypothetical protein
MNTLRLSLLVTFVIVRGAFADSLPLIRFGEDFNVTTVQRTDVQVELRGNALRVVTGLKGQWPGISLPAPGVWDLTAFGVVELDVRNVGKERITVTSRVDNRNADGKNHCVSDSVRIEPAQTQTLRVRLKRSSGSTLNGKLFGMRGYPVAVGGPGTVDPSKITQLLVFVAKPGQSQQFDISNVRAAGKHVEPTASVADASPFFPFIDTFGQYKHKDWPGKIHSTTELTARRDAEAKELAANPSPKSWNKFGGWAAGPQLKATGFFRTEKRDGKWWLVDPEGRLFFSTGMDCVGARHYTPIEERDEWFADFSAENFKPFVSKGFALKGHYSGRTVKTFSFNSANIVRKYGDDAASADTVHKRLRSWGFNTIANWSDDKVRMMRRTAYTDAIGSRGGRMIGGSEGYWGKFPDPFDPALAKSLREQMERKRGRSAGDEWCIGYFSDNEMSWGDDLSLAIATLRSPADQPAKQAFVSELRGKYGEIAKLNSTWGAAHQSWDALLQSTNAPDKKKAGDDLAAFYTRIAEQYFRTVREAIKAVAPQQLYLGCRFAWVNARAAAAAAKHCDVVSYNLYRRSVAEFEFNGGADVPLIIGEFHFGALDRGMTHTGLAPTADQAERAAAYKSYVEGALKHPQFVGCHWFEYQDEPLTGRVYDEENYQIGFVDVADTPYAETVAAAREVGARMYSLRSGK